MSTAPLADAEPSGGRVDAAAPDDRPSRSSWPRTRLVSFACTLGLALALASPLPFAGVYGAVLALTLVPLALATFAVRWSFDSRALRSRGRMSIAVVAATVPAAATGVSIVTAVGAVLGIAIEPWPVALSLLLTIAVACAAAAARAVELRVRRASRLVYLAGSEEQRRDLQRQALRHGDMRIVGFTRLGEPGVRAPSAAQLAERIAQAGATTLVLSAEAIRDETICAAAALCNVQGRRIRTLSGFYEEQFKRIPLSELAPSWFLFDIAEIHRPRLYAASKRAFELLFAALALALLMPLLVLIGVAVALSSRGPVLFRQPRAGRAGEPFTIVKFRTMRPAEDAAPSAWATSDAARITASGTGCAAFASTSCRSCGTSCSASSASSARARSRSRSSRDLEARIPFYAARHVVRPGAHGLGAGELRLRRLAGRRAGEAPARSLLRQAPEPAPRPADPRRRRSARCCAAHDDVSDPQPAPAGA